MRSSDTPTKFRAAFASEATDNQVREIPLESQVSVDPGRASLKTGFPPKTMLHPKNGGVPPSGKDFNGILKMITTQLRWASAGGPTCYDAAFSAENNGYPAGAILSTNPFGGLWLSTVDNNTSDPDAGGANWTHFSLTSSSGAQVPMRGIIMWSGTVAPDCYSICDGTNGTPDLRDMFIMGAGGSHAVGDVGGSATPTGTADIQGAHAHGGATTGHALTEGEMANHSHGGTTDTQGEHAHNVDIYAANSAGWFAASTNNGDGHVVVTTGTAGAHSHNVSIAAEGGGQPHAHPVTSDGAHQHNITITDGRPPFYALAFIQRVA